MYLGSDYLFRKDLAEAIVGKLSHGVLNLITGKCRNSMKKKCNWQLSGTVPTLLLCSRSPEWEFLVGEVLQAHTVLLPQDCLGSDKLQLLLQGLCVFMNHLPLLLPDSVGGTLKRTFLSFPS